MTCHPFVTPTAGPGPGSSGQAGCIASYLQESAKQLMRGDSGSQALRKLPSPSGWAARVTAPDRSIWRLDGADQGSLPAGRMRPRPIARPSSLNSSSGSARPCVAWISKPTRPRRILLLKVPLLVAPVGQRGFEHQRELELGSRREEAEGPRGELCLRGDLSWVPVAPRSAGVTSWRAYQRRIGVPRQSWTAP